MLSDANRRAIYDRYGHQGLERAGQTGFSNVEDIFSQFADIFGGFGGQFNDIFGHGFRADGPIAGDDLSVTTQLDLAEAVFGVKRDIPLTHPKPCEDCRGTGAKDGTALRSCHLCGGSGQVAHRRGPFLMQTTCGGCRGKGRVIAERCGSCRGNGEVRVERKVSVAIPSGIDDGQTLRVPGQGLPGRRRGPAGDLYVSVKVKSHKDFVREGDDLRYDVNVSFPQAALGAEIRVPTLDGDPVAVKVPAGIQPGESVLVRGQGVPHLQARGRGNLVVRVQVDVPKRLSGKAKRLLQELQDSL